LNIAVASDEGRARENTKNGRIRAKNQRIGGKIERKRRKNMIKWNKKIVIMLNSNFWAKYFKVYDALRKIEIELTPFSPFSLYF